MDEQKFSLKWNSYQSAVTRTFDELRRGGELVDVTLCCDGVQLHVHRIILSVCSPYFRNLLNGFDSNQRVVFHMRETSAADLYAVVEFIYTGRASVAQSRLSTFLRTAELLQIRGLTAAEEDSCETTVPSASRSPLADNQQTLADVRHPSAADPIPARSELVESSDSPVDQHAVETVTLPSDNEKPKLDPDLHEERIQQQQQQPADDHSELFTGIKEEPDYGSSAEGVSYLPAPPAASFREASVDYTARWSASSSTGVVNSGGSSMYECNVCGKLYKHRDSLLHHRKKHEGLTTCQLCGKVCCIVAELRRHLIVAHSLSPQDIRRLVPSQRRWSANSSWSSFIADNSAPLGSRPGTTSATTTFDRETEGASGDFLNHSVSTSLASNFVQSSESNHTAHFSSSAENAPAVGSIVDD